MKKNGFFLIICSLLLIPIGFFATSCGPNNNEEKIDVKCYRNDNEVDINNTFFQENTDISLKITANQENNPNATIFFDEINPTAWSSKSVVFTSNQYGENTCGIIIPKISTYTITNNTILSFLITCDDEKFYQSIFLSMYKPKAISSDVDTIFPTGNVVQTSSLQTFNITPSVIDDRSTTDSDYKQIPAELISLWNFNYSSYGVDPTISIDNDNGKIKITIVASGTGILINKVVKFTLFFNNINSSFALVFLHA